MFVCISLLSYFNIEIDIVDNTNHPNTQITLTNKNISNVRFCYEVTGWNGAVAIYVFFPL